jgi:hypothetical protein
LCANETGNTGDDASDLAAVLVLELVAVGVSVDTEAAEEEKVDGGKSRGPVLGVRGEGVPELGGLLLGIVRCILGSVRVSRREEIRSGARIER